MKTTKPKIHFLSGLGANYLAFSFLQIHTGYEKNYAEWVKPEKNESLSDYTSRLIETYSIKEGDILIGLSFGGIISIEMNKLIKMKKLILVSSTPIHHGMLPAIRYFGKLRLNKLLPKRILNKPNPGNYYAFGCQTDDEKEKLDLFLQNGDTELIYWSIDKLVNWRNQVRPDNVIVINGNKDKIFPVKRVKPDHIIHDGTHLMVYNRAIEISGIINQILAQL